GGLGFEPQWEAAREEAAASLATGDRRSAEASLSRFIDDLADEAGGGVAAALREEAEAGAVASAIEVAYESSGAYRTPETAPAPRWVSPVRWMAVAVVVATVVWGMDRLRGGGDLLWPVEDGLAAISVREREGAWRSSCRSCAARQGMEYDPH